MTDNPYAGPVMAETSGTEVTGLHRLREIAIVVAIIVVLMALILPAVSRTRYTPRVLQCKNNLKNIALALHNYHSRNGTLPPTYTVDADGRPLHSWRTLLLRELDQRYLYEKVDFSKPWNDPANKAVFDTHIRVLSCPEGDLPQTSTTYLAVAGNTGCFRAPQSLSFNDITDDHAKTLMVIEVPHSQAVHWMSPVDADELMIQRIRASRDLPHAGGFNVAFVDGSVGFVSATVSADQLHALMTAAGDDDAVLESNDW